MNIQLNRVRRSVVMSKPRESFSLAFCCIYHEPSNRPIKLKPAQAIANEAVRIG